MRIIDSFFIKRALSNIVHIKLSETSVTSILSHLLELPRRGTKEDGDWFEL